MIDHTKDGIDHLNIYSKGQTELGRWLSNFTKEVFICDDGEFASIEGYWYWLSCKHKDKDKLRYLYGYMAKRVGRNLGCPDWLDAEEFKLKIKSAMEIKLFTNVKMFKEFKKNTLPFTHYYVFGGKIVDVPEAKWILDHWEYLRDLEIKEKCDDCGRLVLKPHMSQHILECNVDLWRK